MKFICLICILIIVSPVFAGTWKDDFEDGDLEGWSVYDYFGGTSVWEVKDGEIRVERTNQYASAAILDNSIDWKDYEISFDAMIDETFNVDASFVLLSVRVSDNSANTNHVGPALAYNWDGKQKIVYGQAKKGQQEIDLNFFDENPLPVELSRWYRLKLSVEGNKYQFYVDDVLQKEFILHGYESGGVMIGVGGCVAYLDNVVITGDDIPNGGSGVMAVQPEMKLTVIWGGLKFTRNNLFRF
jgi:hypothetical protein